MKDQRKYNWMVEMIPGGYRVVCMDGVNAREVRIRKRIQKRWRRWYMGQAQHGVSREIVRFTKSLINDGVKVF